MALILKKLIKGYYYIFDELSDQRVNNYLLMNTPLAPVGIIGLYLYFIFNWGPKFMKNRSPYKLEKAMMFYNLIQIFLNGFLVFQCFKHLLFKFSWICEPINFEADEMNLHITRMTWVYFMLKISDLLDTIFFVFRKKDSQVTFLHVYHHCGMVLLTWVGVKYLAGGMSLFLGWINTMVHMVMYFYYFLTAWNSEYKKNIWWKKYITQIQLAQFMVLIILYGQLLFQNSCGYPKWVSYVFVPQNVFMLVLFGDFYYKTYIKPKHANCSNNIKAKQS